MCVCVCDERCWRQRRRPSDSGGGDGGDSGGDGDGGDGGGGGGGGDGGGGEGGGGDDGSEGGGGDGGDEGGGGVARRRAFCQQGVPNVDLSEDNARTRLAVNLTFELRATRQSFTWSPTVTV